MVNSAVHSSNESKLLILYSLATILMHRLVLPRLMTLLEKVVIDEMKKTVEDGGEVCEDALKILQACQV